MKRRLVFVVLVLVVGCVAYGLSSRIATSDDFGQKNVGKKPAARRSLFELLLGSSSPLSGDDWRNMKAQNRDAMRQASRQIRVKKCDAPNIILISSGDLGYGDVPPARSEPSTSFLEDGKQVFFVANQDDADRPQIHTPSLRRMADEGISFRQYYGGSSTTVPAVCSVVTGLHTGHCRLRADAPGRALRPEDLTVAEVLWKAGYRTGMIGYWPLGEVGTTGAPNQQGFDYSFGYMSNQEAKNYYPPYLWRNDERVLLEGNRDGNKEQFSNDLITEEALAFIDRNRRRPFFMYLTYTMPRPDVTEVPSLKPYENEDWTEQQKAYAAMITRLDGYVGRMLDRLEELGLADNSIVFFSPDNGPQKQDPDFFQSSGPFRGSVGTLLEGGLRIPMIVWGPGRIPPGRVSDHVWAAWDFLPTAAELTNAWRRPRGVDGISQVPALMGGVASSHDFLYWELHKDGFHQAMRMGSWKALRGGFGAPIELYDLRTDKLEEKNVAADNPEIIEKIKERFANARTASADWPAR